MNSTGDGFFVAFDSGRRGIECAIAIQRALAEHRRTSGFALSVRIGLHAADANRRGGDYSGMGVNVAARVAALAGGGEIVASADALADAGDVRHLGPPRGLAERRCRTRERRLGHLGSRLDHRPQVDAPSAGLHSRSVARH